MMKRIKNIFKMTLVMALLLTTFSGAVAVQAAGPGGPGGPGGEPPRMEQRGPGDRDRDRGPDHDRYRDDDHRDRKDPKEEVDSANKKANWALGIAAVAAVIAIAK